MRFLLALALTLTVAGCRSSDDSAGTSNPDVTTPVEVAPDAPAATPTDSSDAG